MKKHELNYGTVSFCERKKLNTMAVVKLFCTENDIQLKDINTYLDKNWKKFAAFVNDKLQKGEIKGVNVKTSNGSEERKAENRAFYNTLDPDLRAFWEVLNNKPCGNFNTGRQSIFQKFFRIHGLDMPKKGSHIFQILNYQPMYELIRDNNLLEAFNAFDYNP